MSGYDNNMRGTLNKNDRKETDKHPDYKGKCEIDGQRYWMDAWIKDSPRGKFMSVSFKPMQEKPAEPIAQPRKAQPAMSIDSDEIPFAPEWR